MYELIAVTKTAFYMDCPAKVGFYRVSDAEVYLIDAGSDKDTAKKVKKILDAQGWTLRAIFNTHSHADHIGGNAYLQAQTGCAIYAPGLERAVAQHPVLEPLTLYGGALIPEMQNKFLMAKPSEVQPLSDAVLPEGLSAVPLGGHCFEMVGFRTADGAVFLADCLSGEDILEKYQIGFLYDVGAYLETLETVKEMDGAYFIPSHAALTQDIAPLAQKNIDKVRAVCEAIVELLQTPTDFETLLAGVFTRFSLTMNLTQRFLIGSTVRSYLTYLRQNGQVDYRFAENKMLWFAVENNK